MSYPPDPNNPYGQQAPPAGYGYPQQQAPGYGYPQQPPAGYGIPPQAGYNQAYVQPAYAGWGSRVAATLVDGLIVGVPTGILYFIGAAMTISSANCTTDSYGNASCDPNSVSGGGIVVMLLGFVLGLGLGLWLIAQEGKTGQTPGKKMVNIRLLREADGQPLGFGMAFVRRLCHAADSIACSLGYLWPIWDAKKQTFADKIMSSVVVKSS